MSDRILIEDCRVLTAEGPGNIRSILLEGGRIAKVSPEPTQQAPEGTRRIGAGGATVTPGLIDTHCHLVQLGERARVLDLRGTTNLTSVRLRLASRVQRLREREWLVGSGWDQEKLSERRYPDREDIDDISARNPVILYRVCSHVALMNSAALAALGIGEETGDPPGGAYARDRSGRLTGIVKEEVLESVGRALPPPPLEQVKNDILLAEFEAAKSGLTMVHCILSLNYASEIQAFSELHDQGRLAMRYRLYAPFEALDYLDGSGVRQRLGGEMLRLQGVKIFADGSLGARTAALSDAYSDDPSVWGTLRHSDEELAGMVQRADSLGHQVMIHAIGDRAIAQALRAYSTLSSSPRRHRIEHASVISPQLVSEAKRLGVLLSVQPHFYVSDFWAEERLGRERMENAYPFRSLLGAGIRVSGGSDAPVEPISPVMGIWAAISREDGQGIGLSEAVGMYTLSAAYSGFDERLCGTVEEGAAADLTVFDSEIAGAHHSMVRRAGVAATIVNGEVAYSYEGSA